MKIEKNRVNSKTNVAYLMRPDGGLGRFQRKIHVLNPMQAKKFKGSYPELPKNDWVDAFVIADHLRFGRIARAVYMDDYCHNDLQNLTSIRFDVIQNPAREKAKICKLFVSEMFRCRTG